MKEILFWLIIIAVLLAACGTPQAQPTTTDESKSPPATGTAPAATPSPTMPIREDTPVTSPVSGADPGDSPTSNETPRPVDLTPSPLDPLPDEENMIRGEAFVDSADILLLESNPVQVNLHVEGTLPTPCHLLRANVGEPDENGRIEVELYSLTEPGVMCIQVIQPFDTTISLGTYPAGTYTVYVNGEETGEFTV